MCICLSCGCSQAAAARVQWHAFCVSATASLLTGAGAAAAKSGSAPVEDSGTYRERIPQLASRMESVLAASLEGCIATAGAYLQF